MGIAFPMLILFALPLNDIRVLRAKRAVQSVVRQSEIFFFQAAGRRALTLVMILTAGRPGRGARGSV